ncbi:4a-hydroxytetrahydrobiopterin dehydratase [Williamsia sp. MIQD14]|uniref:4a-hydroxytetrahydrobiopterin dehydratase n=1 Tax=Williamsia sp. MIQD14 TaxID=3425703 RepID=UPI003D9FE6DC
MASDSDEPTSGHTSRPRPLSPDEIDEARPTLPRWEWGDGVIRRSIEAPSFAEAIEFVRRVAEVAERRDHHPDIDIRWRAVTLALSTHSAGGLTALDLESAREYDALAAELSV